MPTRQQLLEQDARDLARLGYAQQLFREMGGFSNFAISFSIISVLTGAVLLYGYGLKLAGPVINTVGWPVVSVLTLCVAASMAELASAYPTAGGLYFWAFRLGGRGWAWLPPWPNLIRHGRITAVTDMAAAACLVRAARALCRRAARARVRAGFAPGAVDLHRLRRLRPRRGGDGHGAAQLGVGRLPLGGRLRRRRLRAAAGADVVHPEGRRRGHRQRRLPRLTRRQIRRAHV